MVTLCTTTFKNSTLCPHSVFMCFVWISEQTAIISLYNINWLVVITETECVYCAVRAEHLHAMQVNFSLPRVKVQNILNVLERWASAIYRELHSRAHAPSSWQSYRVASRSCVAGPSSRSPPLNLQHAWRTVLVCGNGVAMQLPTNGSVLYRSYSIGTINQEYQLHVNVQQHTAINIKLLLDNTNSKQSTCSISLSLVHSGDQLAKC